MLALETAPNYLLVVIKRYQFTLDFRGVSKSWLPEILRSEFPY